MQRGFEPRIEGIVQFIYKKKTHTHKKNQSGGRVGCEPRIEGIVQFIKTKTKNGAIT